MGRAIATGYRKERLDDREVDNAVVDESLQRGKYGGFHFGTAFFGWLVSSGMAVLLLSILTAAGAAVALTQVDNASQVNSDTASTVGLVGGILFALVLAIAYYAGGYVAGRMARFDGARQGIGVWLIGVLVTLLLGGAGAALGAKFNALQQLNLPSLPVNGASFTKGGLITTLVTFLVTLVAALLGGKAGEAYHRKVDAVGTVART
jgi:hypothetical protein